MKPAVTRLKVAKELGLDLIYFRSRQKACRLEKDANRGERQKRSRRDLIAGKRQKIWARSEGAGIETNEEGISGRNTGREGLLLCICQGAILGDPHLRAFLQVFCRLLHLSLPIPTLSPHCICLSVCLSVCHGLSVRLSVCLSLSREALWMSLSAPTHI
jgi:hypothetical protein